MPPSPPTAGSAADPSSGRDAPAAPVYLLSGAICTILYLLHYVADPAHPHIGGDAGWLLHGDQAKYLRSALAFSHLNLDPAEHWYLPGYALLAAPFVPLVGVHAFGLADLLCLLASLVLCGEICHCIGGLPQARLWGAASFCLSNCVVGPTASIWVMPWSTTGATVLIELSLLLALRLTASGRGRDVFLTFFTATLVAFFRPSDVLPPMVVGVLALAASLRAGTLRSRTGAVTGLAGGMACAGCVFGLVYVAIYGLHRSEYVLGSAAMGFDASLIPLHWVTLIIDPRPLMPDGRGLIEVLPWAGIGMMSLIAYGARGALGDRLETRRAARPRVRHRPGIADVLVLVEAALFVAIYLAYRDIHPATFWKYWNYHYLKCLYPLLMFYAWRLAWDAIVRRQAAPLAIAAGASAILLPWRADLQMRRNIAEAQISATEARLPIAFTSLRDGLLFPGAGAWEAIWFGQERLTVAGHLYEDPTDFRLFPRAGGFLLTPLRPIPAGQALLALDQGTRFLPGQPILVRQVLSYGRPCWLSGCAAHFILPAPALPANDTLRFDSTADPFLGTGWSGAEANGRWTLGDVAVIRLRAHRTGRLVLHAQAFVPPGSPPLDVTITAADRIVLHRTLTRPDNVLTTDPVDLTAGGVIVIRTNARRISTYIVGSPDIREVGLYPETLSITP